MTPDLSEIVVAGPSQGGRFERRVNTADLNGAFAKNGFMLGAAYRKDSADDPIPPEKRDGKITVLTVAPLIGEAITRIHTGQSVGELFQ